MRKKSVSLRSLRSGVSIVAFTCEGNTVTSCARFGRPLLSTSASCVTTAGVRFRNTADTGPQVPLASCPRTNTVCRPAARPLVLMLPATASVVLLKLPSAACSVRGTAAASHGGVSIVYSAAVTACVASVPLTVLKRVSDALAVSGTAVPTATPAPEAAPASASALMSGPPGVM